MHIKIRAPLPIIIGKTRISDLVAAIGLSVIEKHVVIELSPDTTSVCEASPEICSILGDIIDGYSVKTSIVENSREAKRTIMILAYIARDVVLNNTLNIKRALTHAELDIDDGILLCLVSNGGIVFSITRNPLDPVCFRIPSNDYYLVELENQCNHLISNDSIEEVFSWIDALWNIREKEVLSVGDVKIKSILSWRDQRRCYAIVKGKPRINEARVFKVSSWGLEVDILPD